MKNILIVVDGNKKIGLGHWSRCLELARNLKKIQINSIFLVKNKMLLKNNNDNFKIVVYSNINQQNNTLKQIQQLNKKFDLQGIIFDLRGKYSKTFVNKIKKISKLIIIGNDDLENIAFSDMIVLPEINEQFKIPTIMNETKLLSGPQYALLGQKNKKIKTKKYSNLILLSIGGGDKRNLSIKLINEFKRQKEKFLIKIIIGQFFNDVEKIKKLVKNDNRFEIQENVKSLIPFMKTAELGIFSMGISVYESMFVGLPCLVITYSKQNDLAAQKFQKYQCFKNLGYYKNLDFNQIPKQVFSIMENKKLLKKYSKNGKKLVDGKGSLRVSKEIKNLIMN